MADALYNKQPEVRSDSKSMYMLVHLIGRSGFALYRINDPLHHLVNDKDASLLNELKPLLVFPCNFDRQPYFNCIKLESKFYFFGLDHCFGGDVRDRSIFTSVYTIEEEVLTRIKPSEHNDISNYKNLLAQTKNPMHAPKYFPSLFVANHKLYALSFHCFDGMFEVFDPSEQTWQVLPCPYLKSCTYDAPLLLLEQENIVYFSSGDAIPTFNLNTHTWTNYTSLDDDYYFYDDDDDDDETPNPPLFNQNRVSIIGGLAFGFRIDANTYNYVCASSSRGKELMQPNLAPSQAFLDVLRSSRFTYLQEHYDLYFDYIVALQDLDGKQVMCIVTYGTSPSEEIGHNPNNCKTSYVALSFFDVPGDFYTSKDSPPREYHSDKPYADEKAEDGVMVTRFFNAKFRHTSHFVINNSNHPTHGQLVTCFF